jgi:hypothetical protein
LKIYFRNRTKKFSAQCLFVFHNNNTYSACYVN